MFGAGAYLLWGLFPLYWPHLKPAGAAEILAHRFLWSFVFVLTLVVASHQLRRLKAVVRDRRRAVLLVVAAALISVNWYVYIYGVNSGQVVETSLGYFVNPLITVLLGVVVLRERLRAGQWVALSVATVAVCILALDTGSPPWIALLLAFSFGGYGLLKKKIAVAAVDGLVVESGALLLPALALVAMMERDGAATFGHAGPGHVLLMLGAGVVTAVPLLLFAAAARRVPLVSLGLLQYLAPTLQFVLGVFLFSEAMPTARWLGFALVWLALVLFIADQVRHHRTRHLGPQLATARATASASAALNPRDPLSP